ncbi:MAG: DUF1573 domain-containing protein [Pedobacter sp.]|uniref:DUF1573 domain-containing protein n=1 Tax=Pedobacter sp. TaxID=1411316 RepID=UPI002809BC91|nr:DUF1573 domain-containing protein [Pedobacter sp.]MDQ8005132.1 DUF1573 domain-containing protein [Pedobacter sp.]
MKINGHTTWQRKKLSISIYLSMAIFAFMTLSGCSADTKQNLTTVKIEDPERKYFPILQGQRQNINVKVFNTGDHPLKIYEVYPSCGCTVAKYPTKLIPVGEYGTIEMEYNSNKNLGYVGIYTTIKTNTKEGSQTFFFEINVVPDPHYTKDYEELYNADKEANKNLVKELVDGAANQQGYITDPKQMRKFQ